MRSKITIRNLSKRPVNFDYQYGLASMLYFILSSPDDRFIKSFAEGLLMEPGFYLDGPAGKVDLVIERIEILEEITFGDECRFKAISPIYVKTIRKENEELREVDLYPKDPKFYENLHNNLIQRFSEFYDKAPQDHFDIIEINDMKPKRIRISEGYRRCSLFQMRLQASPELLKFAYDAGLGEKNAMGFGCLDILKANI